MHVEDIPYLRDFLTQNREILGGPELRVCCLSPCQCEWDFLQNFLGETHVSRASYEQWDCNLPTAVRYDTLLACSVCMAFQEPKRCFDNMLAACRHLIVLDGCIAIRGTEGREFDPPDVQRNVTPDCMRHTHPPEMVANLPTAFDLNCYKDRLVSLLPFRPGIPADPLLFIGCWRGDVRDGEVDAQFSEWIEPKQPVIEHVPDLLPRTWCQDWVG